MDFKTADAWFTILAVLLVIPVAYTRYPESSEVRLRDYLFNHPNYSSNARPVLYHGTAVNVTFEMFLYAMIQFNERDEVVTTASWIQLHWKDERLSWNPRDFNWLHDLVLHVGDIWTPNIVLFNTLDTDALRLASSDRGLISLTSTGDVYLSSVFIVSTQCSLRIKYFPFDTQMCKLMFGPENHMAGQIVVTMEHSSIPSSITSLEWNLLQTAVSNFDVPYKATEFIIYLQRDPRYYVSAIIVPSTALCLLAFATFLSPPDSGERISLGVSMVLGLTVFQLLVSSTLPTSSKQSPILSNYLYVNFIMSCLVVPFSLVSINITYREKKLTCMKYRRIKTLLTEYLPICICMTPMGKMQKNEVSIITDDAAKNKDETMNTSQVHPVVFCTRNVQKPDTESAIDDRLTKIKEENRFVAVVLDRIFLAGFLTSFTIVIIKTLFDFHGNRVEEY